VQGLDDKGDIVEIRMEGLLARVIQHEIDHLNGRLIIDYMNMTEKLKYQFVE
jgi:peptide deformylase